MDVTSHIGVLYVDIVMAGPQSLKEKRSVLKRLKNDVRKEFNVSIGELDGQDKWQRSILAFGMIGSDNRYIDSCLQSVLAFLKSYHAIEVSDHSIEFC